MKLLLTQGHMSIEGAKFDKSKTSQLLAPSVKKSKTINTKETNEDRIEMCRLNLEAAIQGRKQ